MNVLIWGAGDGGERAIKLIPDQVEIVAFIDMDINKIGKPFFDYPVIAREDITRYHFDYIIVANVHGQSIKKWLFDNNVAEQSKVIDFFNDGLSDVRLATLRYLANEINEAKIGGNVAELGVFQGEFAKYINLLFPQKKLYLFDTFEGFHPNDILVESMKNFSNSAIGEFSNTSVQLVLNKMTYPNNCIIKKGLFPESLNNLDDLFCFVSLDVDLYNPIYAGLEYFYNRLSTGGYIMIHDYNSTRFGGVKEAVRDFSKKFPLKIVPIPDLCGSLIICK